MNKSIKEDEKLNDYDTNDIIIGYGGRFNIYDTKGHTCILPNGYLEQDFREFMINTYGETVTLREFDEKIQDINNWGTNTAWGEYSQTLKALIEHENTHHNMSFGEFIECWLSPPREYKKKEIPEPDTAKLIPVVKEVNVNEGKIIYIMPGAIKKVNIDITIKL